MQKLDKQSVCFSLSNISYLSFHGRKYRLVEEEESVIEVNSQK